MQPPSYESMASSPQNLSSEPPLQRTVGPVSRAVQNLAAVTNASTVNLFRSKKRNVNHGNDNVSGSGNGLGSESSDGFKSVKRFGGVNGNGIVGNGNGVSMPNGNGKFWGGNTGTRNRLGNYGGGNMSTANVNYGGGNLNRIGNVGNGNWNEWH